MPGGPSSSRSANDGLIGNAQAGAATGSRDNANMNTGADGTHASTNKFLWQPIAGSFYAPCVDGDYDFSVFGHEYGHMIENRMIGKGVGARQGNAAGAMGEAFGDFDALAALNELHLAPVPGSDRTPRAPTDRQRLQRHPRLPRGPSDGRRVPGAGQEPRHRPAELRRLRVRLDGPEVHADGEIWSAAQIDLRTCSSPGTRRPEQPRTSRAPTARSPTRRARATGGGSRTTTTRWC